MKTTPKNCLVVGPSWVGDMVMAQSLFMILKEHNSDLNIDVLAPSWSEPLLERMPEVRNSISMPVGHGKLQLGLRYKIGKQLRNNNYDWTILLPNSLKSALIPYWAKIPKRTGFKGEMRYGLLNDLRHLDKTKLTMTVQRFVSLGLSDQTIVPDEYPFPSLELDQKIVKDTLKNFDLDTEKPVFALCPGAEFGPAKRWPIEYFAEIAQIKHQEGWQVWIFGSEKDQNVSRSIADQSKVECINLAGKTSLAEAIDLLSQASYVVTNDSGLMHVAAALDRPLTALYGSSDPNFTPPLNDQARIISLGLECSPCFQRECPLEHLNCLREIKPENVISSIK
ncbi:MAG: lipopolysaccharide heptosyltransferase II [Gammaproteobacteria bacterium]